LHDCCGRARARRVNGDHDSHPSEGRPVHIVSGGGLARRDAVGATGVGRCRLAGDVTPRGTVIRRTLELDSGARESRAAGGKGAADGEGLSDGYDRGAYRGRERRGDWRSRRTEGVDTEVIASYEDHAAKDGRGGLHRVFGRVLPEFGAV